MNKLKLYSIRFLDNLGYPTMIYKFCDADLTLHQEYKFNKEISEVNSVSILLKTYSKYNESDLIKVLRESSLFELIN